MLLLTHQQCEAFLLFDGESVELLGVVHDGVVLPVHVEDQDDVVLLGPVGQQPQHGHTGITGPFLSTTTKVRYFLSFIGQSIVVLPMKDITEEDIESL